MEKIQCFSTLMLKHPSALATQCMSRLKYGFCNKVISKRWNSDQLTTFTTYLSSLLGMITIVFSNHAQKRRQIWLKSVQLNRVSFFRSLLLSKLVKTQGKNYILYDNLKSHFQQQDQNKKEWMYIKLIFDKSIFWFLGFGIIAAFGPLN